MSTATDPRDIVSSRVFPVPRARMFKAWTDPALIARWWGPDGFTNTFHEFDPRPGGQWKFIMHGPNGTDYPNHSVFAEVVVSERIVFDHLSAPQFRVTATFAEQGGGTLVTFHMRFSDAATCAAVKAIVVPANEQNFDRLAAVLAGMP